MEQQTIKKQLVGDLHASMAWPNSDTQTLIPIINNDNETTSANSYSENDHRVIRTTTHTCPSCGHNIKLQDQGGGIEDFLPGLPAGMKFDPSDQEILEHLEAKVVCHVRNLHSLIDGFIPTIQGPNGICYTHPHSLPGVKKDGQVRHFFHRPSKAYTTGTRKRRKVDSDADGGETRWHKTGKTRPILTVDGIIKGYKKILVLYTNYGRQRKPEKTNWMMHQYHLGNGDNEEEKDDELVVSKVFYQTQPRQCSGKRTCFGRNSNGGFLDYYSPTSAYQINADWDGSFIPEFGRDDRLPSFIRLPLSATKAKLNDPSSLQPEILNKIEFAGK